MSEVGVSVCGRLVDYRGHLGDGCININGDGLIESITKEPRYEERHEFFSSGLVVAPGLIDLHVHLRGLGLSYKEDEESGTRAALESGITLVADMPNTVPRLATPEALDSKFEALRAKSYVDYAVYAGVPDDPADVWRLLRRPIVGFKVYPEDLGRREASVRELSRASTLTVLHPEVPEAEERSKVADSNISRSLLRGCWSEALAVYRVRDLGLKGVHVTHVSCPSTLDVAKSLGYTVDTTPHYIFLDYSASGCYFKVNPPLRDPLSSYAILKAIAEGLVDALGSDHAPHSPAEKSQPFDLCPPGIPWLGLWPWLVFRLVRAGYITLPRFLWLTSAGPARVLRLRGYGSISPGSRGNLVVIDINATWRFTTASSKALYLHAFMDEAAGRPRAVFIGGSLAYLDGEVLVRPNVVNAVSSTRLWGTLIT